MDERWDVLVEFYSNDWEYCVEMEKEYRLLAEYYEKDPNVLIARIDGSKNEVQGVLYGEYPHILFYPAKDKRNYIEYIEERDFESFRAFVQMWTRFSELVSLKFFIGPGVMGGKRDY